MLGRQEHPIVNCIFQEKHAFIISKCMIHIKSWLDFRGTRPLDVVAYNYGEDLDNLLA